MLISTQSNDVKREQVLEDLKAPLLSSRSALSAGRRMRSGAKEPRELTSWKEIAAYLAVNVRTAQRWETDRGLPVRRLSSGDRARVLITTDELDRWRTSLTTRTSWWTNLVLWRTYSFIATGLILLVGLARAFNFLAASVPADPVSFRWDGRLFVSLDGSNKELWRYGFPTAPDPVLYEGKNIKRHVWIGDLRGEGEVETVVALRAQEETTEGSTIFCFGSRGRLRWQFKGGTRMAKVRASESDVFHHRTLHVFPSSGKEKGGHWIAVTSVHHSKTAAQLALLDGDGKLRAEYWHNGHLDPIESGDLDGDGRHDILVGGVEEETRQAVLVLFTAPASGAPIRERTILRFGRTQLNQRAERFNYLEAIDLIGDRVHARVVEHTREPRAYVFYTLDRKLNIVDVQPSVALKDAYMRFGIIAGLRTYSDQELIDLRDRVQMLQR